VNVYLLWHMRPLDETETDEVGETEDKLCGVYSSRARAEAARQQLITLPGFRDFSGDFLVDEYAVDRVQWDQGFVSLGPGE
jgi:hypothetical protein